MGWLLNSPHQPKPLKSNLLKCITNNSYKLLQVTTLVSMSKILLSKILKEDTLPPIPTTTQLLKPKPSKLKLLFLVILVKSETDILQYLIAIPPILLVNLKKSCKKSTKEPS